MRRSIAVAAVALLLALVASTAWAYWSASSVAGGTGVAAATSLNDGPAPTGNVVAQAVNVSWPVATLANGKAVGGYIVKRYESSTMMAQTIHSACTGTVTALSCLESSVPAGAWKYTVTPKIGTYWLGQESPASNTVTVSPADSTAPANVITLSGVTGGAYMAGNTVHYRGSASGSFTLTNAVTDAGSGPASSQTTTIGGTTTGWGHTPSTVSTPISGPYVSNPFSWTAATTSAPTEVLTGRDLAGNAAATPMITFVNDSTNPSDGTINYPGGYQPGRSVTVTFAAGTDDGGSGVSTTLGRLRRWSASLSGGVCGNYTAINDYANNPTSPYVDVNISPGRCYMYEYITVDNVGNSSSAANPAEAKIEYAGAVNNTTELLSHWRLGESAATLESSDSFTGPAGTLLSNHTPEIGSIWTRWVNDSITAVLTNENRLRKSNSAGGVGYYTSATPSTANYRVEADVHVKSLNSNDVIGVAGRWNTGATTGVCTCYVARAKVGGWELLKSVNGTATVLGTFAQTLTAGSSYRLTLDMNGSTIRLLVNGVQRISTIDAAIPGAGRAGVRLGMASSTATQSDTAGLHLENFQVNMSSYPRAADSKGLNTGDYKNGVALGVAGALQGDANSAAQFDGVNDYATVARQIADDFSIEFWFKSTQGIGLSGSWYDGAGLVDADISGSSNDFGVSLRSDGKVVAGVGPGIGTHIVSSSGSYNDGAWHHVVFTRTKVSGALALYVDGNNAGTATGSTFSLSAPAEINFGRLLRGENYLAGCLDEIAVYGSVLSETTVRNHYELGAMAAPR